jgi:N-dimethylarginine dimethylaminohydrolase
MSSGFGGLSMTATLERALVCDPETAGWNSWELSESWQSLGFLHRPDVQAAAEQHRQLCIMLEKAGVETLRLPAGHRLSMDAVYAHDASLVTDYGAICLRMGKSNRLSEPAAHRGFYEASGIPLLGAVEDPGTAEAGDIVWLDRKTLLVGRSFRTNEEGIGQLRGMLKKNGIDVCSIPLPYGSGPGICLHLMSLMSMLNESTVLVDLPWLAVETVELLRQRGLKLIEIDYSERETLACNVLALGRNRLLAIGQNSRTIARLKDNGFEVLAFPGSEIAINGGGGPTCLTRPILRRG